MKLTINATATTFYISVAPDMPEIVLTASVTGIAPGQPAPAIPASAFTWHCSLDYPGLITVPHVRVRTARPSSHPPILPLTGNPVRVPFTAVRGGRLTVRVEALVGGQTLTASRNDILIGGTNPGRTDIAGAVSQKLMRQLIHHESAGAQFCDGAGGCPPTSINPNWSHDNAGGVGLGQLTKPPPSVDDTWNWRTNAASLTTRFDGFRRNWGATLHTRMMKSLRFKGEIATLAAWRKDEGLPPIVVALRPLTADQQDDEALRAYNGFGRAHAGEYLHNYIHEFEPTLTRLTSATRTDNHGRPLESDPVPALDRMGYAIWSQISGDERFRRMGGKRDAKGKKIIGAGMGDPDYVANVRASPD